MALMNNIKILRNNLVENGWHMTAFRFDYNNGNYIVLFEVLSNYNPKSMDIVHLTFIDLEDTNRTLEADANSARINIRISEIHEYFHINAYIRYPDFISAFYERFNTFIPDHFVTPDRIMAEQIIDRLNERDHREGFLCYKVKRNPVSKNGIQGKRSIYNDNKARLLRPSLYDYFYKDDTISFVFGDYEHSDAEIISKFAEREKAIIASLSQ